MVGSDVKRESKGKRSVIRKIFEKQRAVLAQIALEVEQADAQVVLKCCLFPVHPEEIRYVMSRRIPPAENARHRRERERREDRYMMGGMDSSIVDVFLEIRQLALLEHPLEEFIWNPIDHKDERMRRIGR